MVPPVIAAARMTAAASACHDGRDRSGRMPTDVLGEGHQVLRRRVRQKLLFDRASQRRDAVALCGERRVGGKTVLHLDRMNGVELAVEIGVYQQV